MNNQPLSAQLTALTQPHTWLNTSHPLTAADLQGRVILLDFWTFCCINCQHVMPKLAQLEREVGDDLTVIGIHSGKFAHEKTVEGIRQAIMRHDITHPVIDDSSFTLWNAFGVRAWPTLMLLDQHGAVHKVYRGEGDFIHIKRDIMALLERGPSARGREPLPIALEKEKAPSRTLLYPTKLCYVPAYNGAPALFIADTGHHRIIGARPDGTIFVSIGSGEQGDTDGQFEQAQFFMPQGLAYKDEQLFVADTANHKLRLIDLNKETVSTLAGTGQRGRPTLKSNAPALSTPLASPWGLAWYPNQETLALAMAGTHQLWSYHLESNTLAILAGSGREAIDDGPLPHNSLSQPSGLCVLHGALYFVDAETSSLRALRNGRIQTLIGTGLFDFGYRDGPADQALMQHCIGIDVFGKKLLIADTYNHCIRLYDPATNRISTFSGSGTQGNALETVRETTYFEPNDIAVGGGKIYVADTNNHRIVQLDPIADQAQELVLRQTVFVPTVATSLPNIIATPDQKVSSSDRVTVDLVLHPEWKMNPLAPSVLTLFDMSGDMPEVIASFDQPELQDERVTLPTLGVGRTYRLQALLYYCKKEDVSSCLLQSRDVTLVPAEGGDDRIVFELKIDAGMAAVL